MNEIKVSQIVDALWNWFQTKKDRNVIKDTTKIYNTKFDCYIDSTISDPLSFTLFELSGKGELIVDDVQRLVGSEAAFFCS